MPNKTNPEKIVNSREHQLDAVLIQLKSQRPSEVWRGMEQIRLWLKENAEDNYVYGVLLDAVKDNRDLREKARNLLDEMIEKGSKSAKQALLDLPSSVLDLLADADDVYYSGDYEQAITLYRQVLRLDSENSRAKDHIAKAELKRITEETASGVPRAAEQYYRKARSYVAARDIAIAMNLLNTAIEIAQAAGKRYPDAEEALNNMQNLLIADEYRQKAKIALVQNQLNDALSLYDQGLALDPANHLMKKELETLQDILRSDGVLKQRRILRIFLPINRLQNSVDVARFIMNSDTPLLNSIENQLNKIKLWRGVSGIFLLLAVIIFSFLYRNGNLIGVFAPIPTNTLAVLPTSTITLKPTSTNTLSPLTAPTIATDTATATIIPLSPTYTETVTIPSPTEVILGIGYINKVIASTWKEPNSGLIEKLGINHPVTILEEKIVSNSKWYRCRWESNELAKEGWILAEYITIGTPTTP